MNILIGHLIGDYLLQSNKLAVVKSSKGTMGAFMCTIHCAVYTLAVLVICGCRQHAFAVAVVIFLTHWPIDRYSLGYVYMNKALGWPKNYKTLTPERLAFLPVVYVAVDNTFHLIVLYVLREIGWL